MSVILSFIGDLVTQSWELLLEASVYVLFGLVVGGMLKMFLSPAYVANHLGEGRFSSVFKAAFLGIPIPLCSCGVLPAAASLKKQGANNGATTAFLISTPESGVDSISITYALLDPIMTIARPVAAFFTAFVAGLSENLVNPPAKGDRVTADLSCPVDNCCSGEECDPKVHARHHSFLEKAKSGLKYAVVDLWGDLASWFFVGIILAGLITVLVPDDLITVYLGGGLMTMLIMLVFGIPFYICATASTPIAAALILKGVSPGAALVFLLVGPATNVTSLSVLLGILGKRATGLYLSAIAVVSVLCGLVLDQVYAHFGVSVRAVVGQAGDVIPWIIQLLGALILVSLSVRPLVKTVRTWSRTRRRGDTKSPHCTCSSEACSKPE